MQIEDILVGDKQLAKEIMYDMKQAELAKEGDASAAPPQGLTVQSVGRKATVPSGPSEAQASTARGTALGQASPRAGLSPRGGTAALTTHSGIRRSSGHFFLQSCSLMAELTC